MATTATELQIKTTLKDDASKKVEGLGLSLGKLSAGIALGTLAASAFQKATSFVTDTIKDSIGAFSEAQAQTAQANAIMKTMNTTLEAHAKTFDEAGKKALQLAFDDEEAQLSLANLYRTTRDMKFSQDALNSAMDLARDKHITLDEATRVLNLAFQGNVRALKPYGIELADTASQMDVLKAVQNKTAGEAEAFSNTFAGGTLKLKNAFTNLKETIGKAIVEGVSPYISSLTDAVSRADDTAKATDSLGKVIYQIVAGVKLAGQSIVLITQGVKAFVLLGESAVRGTLNALDTFSTKVGNSLSKLLGQGEVFQKIGFDSSSLNDQISQLSGNIKSSFDSIGRSAQQLTGAGFVPLKTSLTDLTAVNKDYSASVNQAIKDNNAATQAAQDHAKAIKAAKQNINDFRDSAISAFKAVGDSIKKDLVDETAKYAAQRQQILSDTSSSIADIIVKKQDEAADLTKQITNATTDDQRLSLQQQLDNANAYLAKHAADIQANADAIKTIRDNDLTDEISKIKFQAAEKLKIMDQEHADRISKINSQMDDVRTAYKKKFDDMGKELKKSKLFELLDDLQNIGAKLMAKKKKTAFESSLAEFIGSITGKAAGGPISAGQPYLVGEQGPELIVPGQSGTVIPNGAMGINVNFNGITVSSQSDLDRIISAVKATLARELKLAKLGV